MSEIANPGRERILARIGRALQNKAEPPVFARRPVFPSVSELLPRFEVECKHNYTECIVTNSPEETSRTLCRLLAEIPAGQVFAQDAPLIRECIGSAARPVSCSNPGKDCQATITLVEALIAATGSLLVSSSCGGRSGSVVAPVHIAVADEKQLVADLEAAMDLIEQRGSAERNSFLGVITGCSRTADIEKLLVIGAHGPKRLVVILQRS